MRAPVVLCRICSKPATHRYQLKKRYVLDTKLPKFDAQPVCDACRLTVLGARDGRGKFWEIVPIPSADEPEPQPAEKSLP
jgi:hypothetical protein